MKDIIFKNIRNEISGIKASMSHPASDITRNRLSFLNAFISEEYLKISEKDFYNLNNIRILYNTKNGKITDLLVTEFSDDFDPQSLYHKYNKDVGNCLSIWDTIDKVNFIWIDFFVVNEFYDENYKFAAYYGQFRKIKEFRDIMIKYNKARNMLISI